MSDYSSKFGYTPNLTFTLEKHLKNFGECEENARRLLESFHIIREKMEVNLRPVIALFPHYSEHSHGHSENIIAAIEKVLGRTRIEQLSPADTWMLLVCAYMHDLGMLVQGKELQAEWGSEKFQTHIENCLNSHDDELKKAAVNVREFQKSRADLSWPVRVYRDVILLASEYYRSKHPERAKELPNRIDLKQMLNVIMSSDGRIPPRIQEVIGKICFSHGTSFEHMLTFLEPLDSILGYTFHPRFVASMLCLGDLCDLDNGRFNKMAIEVFGGLTKSNLVHYYKHESVTSFVIEKDIISITYDIPNKAIKQALKGNDSFIVNPTDKELQEFCDEILLQTQNWIAWMEDIVKNIKLYWNELAIENIDALTPVLNYKILIDGQTTISSKKNMRFSFSNEKAYELIESYSLYNNKLIFIRELLQNSIDALKLQFWKDILEGRWNHLLTDLTREDGTIDYMSIQPFDFSETYVFDYYKVKIEVEHEEDEQYATFRIIDSGTGISKEDVENRIIKTGIREKSNNDFVNSMPEWLKPTSAFGIGLHSVFAVTDTLFVRTKTESDSTVYNINMHSGKLDGYIFMSVAEQQDLRFCNCTHGTSMEFTIDVSQDMIEDEEIMHYSDEFLRERPESDFCVKVQKVLKDVVQNMLFNISYQFNLDKPIKCKKIYEDRYLKMLFEKNKCNYLFEKRYYNEEYDFALDIRSETVVLWDRKRYISMVFRIDIDGGNTTDIYCKGFKVKEDVVRWDNAPFSVEYWGGNSKDIVNTSRTDISKKLMKENEIIFKEANMFLAKLYYILLERTLKDKEIQAWKNDISEFVSPWLETKKPDTQLPDLSERISGFMHKYNNRFCDDASLKIKILKHGFCRLIKLCKGLFCEILDTMEDEEKTDSIVGTNFFCSEGNSVIKEQTYLLEYIKAAIQSYDTEEEQEHIRLCLHGVFKAEFCFYFKNIEIRPYAIHEYRENGNGFFGEIYSCENIFEYDFIRSRDQKSIKYYKEKEGQGYMLKPLDFYLWIPLTKIVFILMKEGIALTTLKNDICSEIKLLPGYDDDYNICNIDNVGDILLSERLVCQLQYINEFVVQYLPILKWKACKNMEVDADGNLVAEFTRKKDAVKGIEFKENTFAVFLQRYKYSEYMILPRGYEKIALEENKAGDLIGYRYRDSTLMEKNYKTYMWKDFNSICIEYGPRLKAGETKEQIADEIMPKSREDKKPVTNLLRNIYHNRALDKDKKIADVWDEISDTYRSFVLLVLGCIE